MNRSPWRLEEVDGSPWRQEEVYGGDEQYPVESRFVVRHTPPDEHEHALRSYPASWLPRVPLPPDEHDAFYCLPMNTTHYVASP